VFQEAGKDIFNKTQTLTPTGTQASVFIFKTKYFNLDEQGQNKSFTGVMEWGCF
jgi:hypothetical protein